MEYAFYEAFRCGFVHVVLVIKPGMENDARALFGARIECITGTIIDYAI